MRGPLVEIQVSERWATGVLVLADDRLLTTGVDTVVKLWDSSGTFVRAFEGHEKSVAAMAVCPDGHHLLTGSVDGTARLWTIDTGESFCVLKGHKKTVASVAFLRQGAPLTGSYDRTVRLWDAESCEEVMALKGHPNNVVGLAVAPDASLVATGGVGPELRLWSMPTGELLTTLHAHELAVIPVAFSADGATLITVGADDELATWDVSTLAEKSRVPLGAPGTHTARLSPDGRSVAVAMDHAVRVFNLRSCSVTDEITFDVKGVYGVSFSADGAHLATATADSYVRTWALG